jgi:hypothetical protein
LRRLMFRSFIAIVIAMAPGLSSAQAPRDGADPADATPPRASDSPPPAAQPPEPPASSPLTLHIGDTDFLVGGFMDATVVWRSTNHGSGIGTSFGTIPFSNTPQGNLGETRFSTQNSRISLMTTSKVNTASLRGYVEADFLGNAPNGINVTSNANTLRMRLYWVQFTPGKFEFLAGQSWSMLTPNRTGLSPVPGDLFYSQDVDTNYQLGLTWGRTTQFRFIAHASDVVTAGLSLENPEQYVGSAVALPTAFPVAEVDNGGVTVGTPNPYPDVIGKIAFDPKPGNTHQHIDAAVLLRGYKTYNQATNASASATGTGESVNAVIEPVKNFRLIGNAFFSKGGGRYIANTNIPDLIVNADQSVSLVKSRSFIGGAEVQAPKVLLYGYYSAAQADQNVTFDTNGKAIGFGVAGSAAANHKLSEATVGITGTFFRDPKIGAMQLMVQYSNLKRTPFSVPAGAPSDAKLNMVYVNVRYVLP